MALHVHAYNLTRVINIRGTGPLMAAMRAYARHGPERARGNRPSKPIFRPAFPLSIPGRPVLRVQRTYRRWRRIDAVDPQQPLERTVRIFLSPYSSFTEMASRKSPSNRTILKLLCRYVFDMVAPKPCRDGRFG